MFFAAAAARQSRLAVIQRPAAARAGAPFLVDNNSDVPPPPDALEAARAERGEYEAPLTLEDIDNWQERMRTRAREEPGEDETPMTKGDIDEWLATQTGTIDAKAELLLGDLATTPGSALPKSGREEWGTWMQSDSEMCLELFVPDETRGKQVRCEVLVGFLDVRVDDVPLLSGRLAQEARPLDLQWLLDTQADGRKVLCIDLPKRSEAKRGDKVLCIDGPLFKSLRVDGEAVATSGLVG